MCWEDSSVTKIWQELRVLYMKTCVHLWYLAKFFSERDVFQTKSCRENQNTHFMFSKFLPENRGLWDNVDNNTANELCMLYNWGYRHTLRICNTYCFSKVAVVTQMCLSVTVYVRWLSCYVISACHLRSNFVTSFTHVWGYFISETRWKDVVLRLCIVRFGRVIELAHNSFLFCHQKCS